MADAFCTDCKQNTEVVFDHSAGDTVCSECGLVLESHSIDETSEWRTFANESGDNDPVRVGGPTNPLLMDGGLSTVISKPNGNTSDYLSSSLGRWQNRGSNPDRTLILAFKTIATMADRLGLVATIKDRANEIYKKVEDQKSSRGRNQDAIYAACLFIACKQEDKPRTVKEICSIANGATKKEIGRAKEYIVKLLEIGSGPDNPDKGPAYAEKLMRRFCSNLGMSNQAVKAAQETVKTCEEFDIRRSPISIAAAVIYIITQLSEAKKPVRVLGCSFKSFCRQRVSFRVVGVRLFGERKATAGMALVPARREYAISEVDLGIGLWTVIVHVVESHRVQHSSGNHGGRPRPYKRFLLVDQHGTKVSGVLYDKDIDYFSTSLQPFKRYRISNARLTPAFGFFRVGDYNFSWIITNDTPVELIEETHVPPLPFSYPICPFTEFFRHADKEGGFNVKAIAIHAFPQRQVTRNSTVREVVVIDESKQPMILSLWNHFGDVEGKIIADNIANTPLIIGLNMKATTFHGLALGSRPFSYILIDPPLLDTPSLKEWFALNKAEINQLLQDKAYNNTNLLLPPPSIADAIDVPTAVATLNMVNTAWVFGQVRFTAAKRAYHIVACPNCHKKVDAAAGWNLRCNSCGEYDQTELRCRVPMEITGGNQSLRIVMTSPDVEQVTGLTPQMLNDSYEFDFGMQDHLQAALDKLNVVCFIKKYDPSTLGAPSTAGLRYTVVKAYKMDTIDRPPASSPSSSAPPQLKLPNDEQQLFTPKTKKNMTELEALPTPEKTEQSAPPSKRSLDFAVAQSADASLPTHPSYASSTSTNEPTDVHTSPAKKGKEKQVSE